MLIVLIILIACVWLLSAIVLTMRDERFAELRDWYKVRIRNYCSEVHNRFQKLYKKEKEIDKFFEKYLDLSPNIRMMIIDQMRAKDRCRFTRCSKLSNKEVKGSNYYIQSLAMYVVNENCIEINIGHGKEGIRIHLKFVKKNGRQWLEYASAENNLWREDMDHSTDFVKKAADNFKHLLKNYQNKIKCLFFRGSLFDSELKDYDFGIENLEKLEDLNLQSEMDVSLYLSKLQHPLKFFSISGTNNLFLNECIQVYQVQDYVFMPETKMLNYQFLRLSARSASLNIGYLTKENIYKFVRSWKKGTIGKEIKKYEWDNVKSSDFDINKLFELFGVEFNIFEKENVIKIKHDKEEGKRAKLSYCSYNKYLSFEVIDKNRDGR